MTVPWSGCWWVQHICGQQTARNSQHPFLSVHENKILFVFTDISASVGCRCTFPMRHQVVSTNEAHSGDLQINLCSRTLWMNQRPRRRGRRSRQTYYADIHDLWLDDGRKVKGWKHNWAPAAWSGSEPSILSGCLSSSGVFPPHHEAMGHSFSQLTHINVRDCVCWLLITDTG